MLFLDATRATTVVLVPDPHNPPAPDIAANHLLSLKSALHDVVVVAALDVLSLVLVHVTVIRTFSADRPVCWIPIANIARNLVGRHGRSLPGRCAIANQLWFVRDQGGG